MPFPSACVQGALDLPGLTRLSVCPVLSDAVLSNGGALSNSPTHNPLSHPQHFMGLSCLSAPDRGQLLLFHS